MSVWVVGSINADVALEVARLPEAGATVVAGPPVRSGGGKGANVAVAAARAGADVRLVGAVGDDDEGDNSRRELAAAGVDVGAVAVRAGEATGLAMICVDAQGENFIVVAPGANGTLDADHVAGALDGLEPGDVCVVNFEVPEAAVTAAAEAVAGRAARLVVNPSPVRPLAPALLTGHTTFVLNAGELAELGLEAEDLPRRGAGAVVVTLGADGARVLARDVDEAVAAVPARVVDTTGAGDAFTGALAAALAGGTDLVEAARRGAAAGALATETAGARAS